MTTTNDTTLETQGLHVDQMRVLERIDEILDNEEAKQSTVHQTDDLTRLRTQADIHYEWVIDDVHFTMLADGSLCWTDYQDESKTVWACSEHQTQALVRFIGEMIVAAVPDALTTFVEEREQLKAATLTAIETMEPEQRERLVAVMDKQAGT